MNKRKILRIGFGIKIVMVFLLAVSCAVNPVSGERELMLVSESKEIEIGRQTDKQVVEQYGIYEDKTLSAYLDGFCKRLGKLSHRPDLPYQCKVLDSAVVNAFAVPGGYVYFTRGILAYLNSEAELVGVMGHELGHVTARHSAKQISRAQLAQLGLGVGMILSETFRDYSRAAQFGVGMLFLKFSRDNERQADDLGVEYSTKGGYDATHMAGFFETLDRMHASSDRSGLPSWFSTHPDPEDRQGAVRRRALAMRQEMGLGELKVNREAYLERIEGLVYGEDPREGYVENNVFYHPVLKFQFALPDKWQLQNTKTQVRLTSPKQDALILFTMASGKTAESAGSQFLNKTGAVMLNSGHEKIDGLPAYQMTSQLVSSQGILKIRSTFILKDNRVFEFHGVCSVLNFSTHCDAFQNTMTRFKNLTDPKKIDVKPARIRVRKVKRAGSLKTALLSLGAPQAKLETLALLNGKKLDDQIPENTFLKVVEGKGWREKNLKKEPS